MSKEMRVLCKELVESHREFLYSQALRMTKKAEDAEDLLHDTVVLVNAGFESFRKETNFKAWARRIMLNHHINQYRKKASKTVLIDDFSGGDYDPMYFNSPDFTPDADNPESCYLRKHINPKLIETYYGLDNEFRVVFNLYHFEGYNYDEISHALSLPLGTVKSRIYRSKRFLVEALREHNDNAEYDFLEGRLR